MRLKRTTLISVGMLLCAFNAFANNTNATTDHTAVGRVAIVIDDLGYHHYDMQAVELPGHITASILPHTPYAEKIAKHAQQLNKDVMLHIPMEAMSGKALGPGALTAAMKKDEVILSLMRAKQEIPFAVGVNNHMGSRLTAMQQPMQWTMEFLRKHNMFFLDSKTVAHSKAETVAKQNGVHALHRHVFLDNIQTEQEMLKEFKRMIRIAQRYKSAVAIAHPYPETFTFLRKYLPELKSKYNVDLVPISELLPQPNNILLARAENGSTKNNRPDNHSATKAPKPSTIEATKVSRPVVKSGLATE
ncbi:divergent polysaccharide deacetylase family protein [Flocculibacter collagenilyticus]|uniref:divergent polysaccharide deacetylase family protein n=1 Tax=Flocculibacter collagenilyticus TaxID=2744479 RepID=UPI001F26B2D1|nr:divergent polysaccharide deacetylase family protein [Flocculibacter collagenilyticus]